MSNMLLRGNVSYQQRARLHARESHLGRAKAPHATPLHSTAHKRNNPHSGVIHGHGSAASGHHNQTNSTTLAHALDWASSLIGGAGATSKGINMAANANRNQVGRFRPRNEYLPSAERTGKAAQKVVRASKEVGQKVARVSMGKTKEVATKVGTGMAAAVALGYGALSGTID